MCNGCIAVPGIKWKIGDKVIETSGDWDDGVVTIRHIEKVDDGIEYVVEARDGTNYMLVDPKFKAAKKIRKKK